MSEVTIDVIKIFTVGFFSFLLTFLITPTITHFLYKYKLWKKESKEESIDGKKAEYFKKHHAKEEVKTPRIGGLLIWTSVSFLIFFLFLLSNFFDFYWIKKLNFLSRDQTWLPLFTLISASLVGLVDDLLQILDCFKNKHIKKGLSLRYRLLLVSLIGFVGGWWFYFRLGQDFISVPFFGDIHLGLFYIPFFIIVMIAIYSGGVIDGIDGLSAGTFVSIFTAYTAIAFFQGQINLATFCLATIGSILAFLWYNIPPARFYMGETGVIGLTATLTVVAFLTNAVAVLPIIAFLLVITSASVIIQLLSKKIFKRRVFLAAPLHHHLEAVGWPPCKVVMRFWIIGAVVAILGVVIHLLGQI